MVKTLIALPILTNFTQHLVKIGLKLVLNSFSSLKLQIPRPGGGGGGGGGGGVLPYKDSMGMCRAKAPPPSAPPPPIFRTWLLYCFDVGHSKRPPSQKCTIFCSAFPTWADRKDRRFKNIYVSLLFLTPKSPVFPVRGRSEITPPLAPHFQWGRSLSPPPIFKQCAANIYQFHI